MYNTIIVPTDFNDEKATVKLLLKADKLSENGNIELIHVLHDLPSIALVELPAHLMAQQEPEAISKLEKIVKNSSVNAKIKVTKGQPHRRIIDEAKNIGADLILLNSHQPGFQDYLLGSTASKIVRHAPCSVLIQR